MNIDDIAEKNVTGICKENGKPIIDGKCVCPGKQSEKQCGCQNHIDIMPILPFLIHNAGFYKGFS